MLNPVLNEIAATERLADLRRAGRRSPVGDTTVLAATRAASRERRRRGLARPQETVGWLLVSIGLRLAVSRQPAGSAR